MFNDTTVYGHSCCHNYSLYPTKFTTCTESVRLTSFFEREDENGAALDRKPDHMGRVQKIRWTQEVRPAKPAMML